MNFTRRSFLTSTLVAAAGAKAALASLGQTPPDAAKPAEAKPTVAKAEKPLKILFLGGTVFLGPHTVDRLLARGHTVTLFNRGKSFPDLYPELEKLRGDRGSAGKVKAQPDFKSVEAEIAKGRKWDVVIDTSAYVPKFMRASAEVLKDAVSHYVMVASVNAYKSESEPDQDEDAPTWDKWPDEAAVDEKTYGPMKRGCEVVLSEVMPGRWASARPSLIVGPRDWSSRFSYWPLRAMRGGEILAPVGPSEPCKFVDARDCGNLLVLMAEKKAVGPVNALGAPGMTWGPVLEDVLAAAKAAGAPPGTISWVSLKHLNANNVQPWSDLPAWIPSADPEYAGACSRTGKRSAELGATWRSVKETSADIIKWWDTLPEARKAKPRPGLSPEREADVLSRWQSPRPQ